MVEAVVVRIITCVCVCAYAHGVFVHMHLICEAFKLVSAVVVRIISVCICACFVCVGRVCVYIAFDLICCCSGTLFFDIEKKTRDAVLACD